MKVQFSKILISQATTYTRTTYKPSMVHIFVSNYRCGLTFTVVSDMVNLLIKRQISENTKE